MESTVNKIDSSAIVSPNVIIGKGNVIGPGAIITDNVVIGDNNYIGAYTTIGTHGEYKIKAGIRIEDDRLIVQEPKGKIIIGNNNIIREYVAIQSPVLSEQTVVGNNCFIMNKVHVAHDCVIADNVTIAPMVCLGGSVELKNFVNIGIGVAIHPRICINEGVMIGMNAVITKEIPAWKTVVGINKIIGFNERGMKKIGWTDDEISKFISQ